MTRIRSLAAALSLTLAAAAGCAHPAPPNVVVHAPGSPDRKLTANGTATILLSPDCADLTMTIAVEGRRPGDAMAAVQAQQAKLVAALAQRGVTGPDLTLSQLGVDPVFRYVDQRSVLDGFSAHVTVLATTRQFDQIAPLMQAGADAGVTAMSARFRRSDLDALRKQVRDQALAAAQAKATETAAVLGIHLGAIVGVTDASQSYLFSNEYFPSAATGGSGLGGEVQPLTVEVTLTYSI